MRFRLALISILHFVCNESSCSFASLDLFKQSVQSDSIEKSLGFLYPQAIDHVVEHVLQRHLELDPNFYFYDDGGKLRIRASFKIAESFLKEHPEIEKRQKVVRIISTLRKLWGVNSSEEGKSDAEASEVQKMTQALLGKSQKTFDDVFEKLIDVIMEIVNTYSCDLSIKEVEDLQELSKRVFSFEMLESAEKINNTSGQNVSNDEEASDFFDDLPAVEENAPVQERKDLRNKLEYLLPRINLNSFFQSLDELCEPFQKLLRNYEGIELLCEELGETRIIEYIEKQKKPILAFLSYVDVLRGYISQQFWAFNTEVNGLLRAQNEQQDMLLRQTCRGFLQTLERVKVQFDQTKVYVFGIDFERTDISTVLEDLERRTTITDESLSPIKAEIRSICEEVLKNASLVIEKGEFTGVISHSNDLTFDQDIIGGFSPSNQSGVAPLDGTDNRGFKESCRILFGMAAEVNALRFSTLFPISEMTE